MNHTGLEFRSSILQNSLSCFSPKIHLQDLWKRFQFVLDHNLGHFEANLFDRAEIVMEAGKYRAFLVRLNSRSEPRTKLVAKTPNPQILARVSLCWPPMSVCWKNVYALRACKRSNRDFFAPIYRKYLYILSYPVFLYYAESPKVPPRVFGPLGPKTLRGQWSVQNFGGHFLALVAQINDPSTGGAISSFLCLTNPHNPL